MRPVAKQFGDVRSVYLVVASVDVGALSEAAAIHHQQPVMPSQSTLRLEAGRAPRHGTVNQYHARSIGSGIVPNSYVHRCHWLIATLAAS
jgi:hypothetical protein